MDSEAGEGGLPYQPILDFFPPATRSKLKWLIVEVKCMHFKQQNRKVLNTQEKKDRKQEDRPPVCGHNNLGEA